MNYRHITPLMNDAQRVDAARRLIEAAGFSFDDQRVVMDIGVGYAGGENPNRGMSNVWVTGNWNDIDRYDGALKPRVVVSTMPGRLFDALERLGVNGEWYDQWERCENCQQLIRTSPDSYAWTPDYVLGDSGFVCHTCAAADAEEILDEQFVNRADRAVTWLTMADLEQLGWHDAFPGEPDAQNGMHPGQADTPEAMVERWRATLADDDESSDFLFIISDKGQFDISFRMLARDAEDMAP